MSVRDGMHERTYEGAHEGLPDNLLCNAIQCCNVVTWVSINFCLCTELHLLLNHQGSSSEFNDSIAAHQQHNDHAGSTAKTAFGSESDPATTSAKLPSVQVLMGAP